MRQILHGSAKTICLKLSDDGQRHLMRKEFLLFSCTAIAISCT